jgi:hypothetical protein
MQFVMPTVRSSENKTKKGNMAGELLVINAKKKWRRRL